jgi:hypothetical protein
MISLEEQIGNFRTLHRRKEPHFNVAPRYSAGSPALVDESIALRVALQEQDCYDCAKDGRYGADMQKQAASMGLSGIVELRAETKDGWAVLDLLTQESFTRPFPGKKKK